MTLKEKISLFPHSPGVYRYLDSEGNVIYVGKATDIYGVEGIPHLMLIGPDGTILKRGFHGLDGIQAAVSEYLK